MNHLRALRPHQWIKNFFVFAALVFSRRLTDPDAALRTLVAFAAFCAVASAIYLVNDVADYERDRVHPTKRNRPIAAGKVSRGTALVMAAVLAPLGIAAAFWLNVPTGVIIGAYGIINLTYSLWLKHVVLLDVFIIALGFLLRVTVGAVAIPVPISPWLLICTFFIALFLGICKRRHELVTLGEDAASHRGILAHYNTPFIDKMVSALAGMTVMSYALYTIDPRVAARLGTDGLVLTVPFVLFGIFRYLYLVHLRQKGGSPTEVVLTDKGMQTTIALYLGMTLVLIYFNVNLGLTA
jgi:4-hydroxybenzoate polyprenyltransferase